MDETPEVNRNPDPSPEVKQELSEQAAPVDTAFASPASARKRSPKALLFAIIVIILVVLLGGSAAGYTIWYQNSDKVVHDAILHAMKAKTISSTGTISYTAEGFKLNLDIDGKTTGEAGELSIDATIAIDAPDMKQEFSANGTGRLVGDTLYVKFKGVKDIVEKTLAGSTGGQIPEYATDMFDKIEDKWISIKPSDYKDFSSQAAEQQTCITDVWNRFRTEKAMTNEVATLYKKNQIVIIKEKLGSKNVNGTSSLGYEIEYDEQAATSFAQGLKETELGKALVNCSDDTSLDNIADSFKNQTSEESPKIELWVSKLGHEVTELSINKASDKLPTFSVVLQPTFNRTDAIEAPTDATSLETILGEIRETIMNSYMNTVPEMEDIPTIPAEFEGQINFQPTL